MKRPLVIFIIFLLSASMLAQTIPYHVTPDWTSTPNGHIATGLGLADINGDGWKDIIAANGNDIQRQRLVVYYNNGDGTFPPDPDWQSLDIDYHGHLACGDIDQDGDIDVAVSVYLGANGFLSPGKVKVYYNEGNGLESTPSFTSSPFFTFSCSLGDADGDGDLDLAAAAGEPYNNILDRGKIFVNEEGTFQASPEWESDLEMGALDVEFGDINRDGLMDIIFVCENDDNYIYLGQPAGGISTSPSWQSAEPLNFINSVDIGYREPGECLVVMTENSQLGGEGKVRRYLLSNPLPATGTADWYSNPFGYGSGIILADVDADSRLDLVYGGWWLPMKIALGDENGFQVTPGYTSSTNSVVEAIQMADLGKESILEENYDVLVDNMAAGSHVIVLPNQLTESLVEVEKDGTPLTPGEFCYVPNKSWISFAAPFQDGDSITVTYQRSPHPDIVITNWDSGKGNYIFYNTNPPVGLPEIPGAAIQFTAYPNPATRYLNLQIQGHPAGTSGFTIVDITGRVVQEISYSGEDIIKEIDISGLAGGVYFLQNQGTSVVLIKK